MKKLTLFVLLTLLPLSAGCTTIYKAAVEERSLSTQASDTKTKAAVLKAFVDDPKIKVLDISPECYEGHVYLVGEYGTQAEKDRAIELAKKTEGVKKVTAYILPKKKDDPCGTKVNLTITAKVKAALIRDTSIWSTNIEVKTVQCNVVLLGIVGTKDEVNKSISYAKGVEGVHEVVSYLKPVR